MFKLFACVALAMSAALANASDKPPLTLPTTLEGMPAKGDFAQPFNFAGSYVGRDDAISLYVFRATNPNAALWFERAETILQEMWKTRGLGAGGEVRRISVAGSPTPNGLARVFAMSGRNKSTALAVAQVGGWMVKVRSTSGTLSVEEQVARLDRILAAFGPASGSGPVHPLQLPEACPVESAQANFDALLGSSAIDKPTGETILAAGPALMVASERLLGGKDSLAAAPQLWCRAPMGEHEVMGALYRPKDAARKEWTVLLADSGTSISGLETLVLNGKETKTGGMMTANGLDKIRAIVIAEGVPTPEVAFPVAARHLMAGSKAALAAVEYGTSNIEVSLPK